jgi:predicted dehydrogenase
MKTVRLGVIGCGVIGRIHAEKAKQIPFISLVAIADLREEVARELAQKLGVPKVYTRAEDLLADRDVDAVVLAMPTCHRTPLALQAFALGKHVLTEKPVAMNAGEVRQMMAAQGDRVAACCSSRMRFGPSARAISDFIASGALGPLRLVRYRHLLSSGPLPKSAPPAWRLSNSLNGGGIFMNWGCYDLDYLLGITGWSLNPRLVLAQMWEAPAQFAPYTAPGSDAESHVVALVRCENGAAIALERGQYVAAEPEESFQVVGEKGSLRMKMSPSKGKVVMYDDAAAVENVSSRTLWQGDEDWSEGHSGPVRDFAGAILEKREPMTGLSRALLVQQITDAIYASARQGQAVQIS